MKRLVSIWLLFSESDSVYLGTIIKKLAKEYDAPEFYPHLTIYGGGLVMDVKEAEKITTEAVKDIDPFTIEMKKINFTANNIWKTVFIEVQKHPMLDIIYENLRRRLLVYKDYEFLPHISLIYKNISEETKIEIIRNLTIKKTFLIDAIGIASTEGNRNNASSWKLLFKKNFKR